MDVVNPTKRFWIDWFSGRDLVLATKHGKEQVIRPLVDERLGARSRIQKELDTDLLGTFTGEVERSYDPLTTVRLKCEMALDLSGADLAIATEGSFGPHPQFGIIPLHEEIVFLLDRKNHLEVFHVERTSDTNFLREEVHSSTDLLELAQRAGFPDHALILRDVDNVQIIHKAIQDPSLLMKTFEDLHQGHRPVSVETDMRAHLNPTRMKVIEKATIGLIERLNHTCPNCASPGFGMEKRIPGLPCSQCGLPTRSPKGETLQCPKCGHQEDIFYEKTQFEDPMNCDYCNP